MVHSTVQTLENEPLHEKTNNVVSEQVRHKLSCTSTDQRTNGPVNTHLRPEKYTNKLV